MSRLSIIIFLVLSTSAFAQTEMQDRMNLQNLLAERAKNFSAFTSSIQKRSGIFGNKTKGDLQKSNDILIDIVTLDNDIMDALHRSLSYKTFEKTTDNYSSRDCEMKLKQSMQVTDTLMKQITVLEDKIKHPGTSSTVYKILFFLSALACLVLAIRLKRKEA
jgi:hypothetical protein